MDRNYTYQLVTENPSTGWNFFEPMTPLPAPTGPIVQGPPKPLYLRHQW